MTHRTGTAPQLRMTDTDLLRTAEVSSMQRGLRWLALRGVSARPAVNRPAYSPR